MKEINIDEFIHLVTKLEPVEFIGLCKVLCVKVLGEEKQPRKFEELINDIIDNFTSTGRTQRREVLRVLRAVNRRG